MNGMYCSKWIYSILWNASSLFCSIQCISYSNTYLCHRNSNSNQRNWTMDMGMYWYRWMNQYCSQCLYCQQEDRLCRIMGSLFSLISDLYYLNCCCQWMTCLFFCQLSHSILWNSSITHCMECLFMRYTISSMYRGNWWMISYLCRPRIYTRQQ